MKQKSKKEREKYLAEKLKSIVKHAYANAPTVRKKFEAVRVRPEDIRTIKDLERVPVTSKNEMVKLQSEAPPFGGFLAVPLDKLEKVFISPGPIYDPQTLKRTAGTAADILLVAKLGKGDRVVNAFSYHLMPGAHWFDEAVRMLGGTVIPSGVGNTDIQVKAMHDLGVTGYTGTPSFLNTIIKRAEELGYDFRHDFKLRFAAVGAEPLFPSLRQSLEGYGIQVIDTYGTAELGLIAYSCEKKEGLHIVEDIILEIMDPATGKQLGPGEVGEVTVTTFDEAYPLIRYGTGDLSCFSDAPCTCGRSSNRLMRIVGRVGDAVKIRGVFVHPKQVEQCLSTFPKVPKGQLIVDRVEQRDTAVLNIEIMKEANLETTCKEVEKKFSEVCTVRLDKVQCVAPGTIPADAKILLDLRKWE